MARNRIICYIAVEPFVTAAKAFRHQEHTKRCNNNMSGFRSSALLVVKRQEDDIASGSARFPEMPRGESAAVNKMLLADADIIYTTRKTKSPNTTAARYIHIYTINIYMWTSLVVSFDRFFLLLFFFQSIYTTTLTSGCAIFDNDYRRHYFDREEKCFFSALLFGRHVIVNHI